MRFLVLLAALGTILPLQKPLAQAVLFTPSYAQSGQIHHLLHWERFPIRVFLATHNDEEKQATQTTLAGFDEWVHATKGVVRYVRVDAAAQADITICFNSAASLPGQAGVSGRTEITYAGTALKHAGMELAIGAASPDQLQSAAAHEFGHALGIEGHSDNADDLMYPVQIYQKMNDLAFPAFPELPHPVTTRDLNTLKNCYPNLFTPS